MIVKTCIHVNTHCTKNIFSKYYDRTLNILLLIKYFWIFTFNRQLIYNLIYLSNVRILLEILLLVYFLLKTDFKMAPTKSRNILERLGSGEVIIGDGSYVNTLEKRGYVKVRSDVL